MAWRLRRISSRSFLLYSLTYCSARLKMTARLALVACRGRDEINTSQRLVSSSAPPQTPRSWSGPRPEVGGRRRYWRGATTSVLPRDEINSSPKDGCQKIDRIDASRLKPNASAIWVYCFLILVNPVPRCTLVLLVAGCRGAGESKSRSRSRSKAVDDGDLPTSCSSQRKSLKDRLQAYLASLEGSRALLLARLLGRLALLHSAGHTKKVSDAVRLKSRRIPSNPSSGRRKGSPGERAHLEERLRDEGGRAILRVEGERRRVSSFVLVQGPAVLAKLSSLNPSLH